MNFIHQPAEKGRLGDHLITHLNGNWSEFRAAIAFAKLSGTKHLVPHLKQFSKTGKINLSVGIDHLGTSKEALEDLAQSLKKTDSLTIVHNEIASTFHPKVYLFSTKNKAIVFIGSGNLTEGGLFTNYEASVFLELDLSKSADLIFYESIVATLDNWADKSLGTCFEFSSRLLNKLVVNGYIPIEALSVKSQTTAAGSANGQSSTRKKLFSSRKIHRAPRVAPRSSLRNPASAKQAALPSTKPRPAQPASPVKPSSSSSNPPTPVLPSQAITHSISGFVMTLQNTDVGVGQTTKGASRRSPEIFIPIKAVRDVAPQFWGWNSAFKDSPTKRDRANVKMRIGSQNIEVNMMSWKVKSDFRLRSEALRSSGSVGDILRIEKVNAAIGYDYYVEIIPQGTTLFATYYALCTTVVGGNSKKRYGYY